MEILGYILLAVGVILGLVSAIQVLIVAFKTSIVWGLVSLLVPFGVLIFIFTHWSETKKPFLRWLLSFVLIGIGAALSPRPNLDTLPTSEATLNP